MLAAVVLLVMELRKGSYEDYEAGGAAEQALGWSLLVINAIAIITLLSVFFMKQGAVRLLSSRRRVVPVSSDQIVELPSTQASGRAEEGSSGPASPAVEGGRGVEGANAVSAPVAPDHAPDRVSRDDGAPGSVADVSGAVGEDGGRGGEGGGGPDEDEVEAEAGAGAGGATTAHNAQAVGRDEALAGPAASALATAVSAGSTEASTGDARPPNRLPPLKTST